MSRAPHFSAGGGRFDDSAGKSLPVTKPFETFYHYSSKRQAVRRVTMPFQL